MSRPALFSLQRLRGGSCVGAPVLFALAFVLAGGCSGPSERPPANFNAPPSGENALPAPQPADRRAVRAVLRRQRRAWNRGHLESYMSGYARTDTLRFVSGAQVRTGWEETLQRYRQSYPDRRAMGTLSFSEVDVDLLSGRHALVFGRWRLERKDADGGPAGGRFTLLFEKVSTADGPAWRIVHDHTSSG